MIELKKSNSRGPLGSLLNEILSGSEMRRIRQLSRFFDAFHLKHTVTSQVAGRQVVLNDREVVNFGSANYLGYDQHPDIIEAGVRGLRKYGNHSGCSRMFSSHGNLIELESEISALVGSEKTLVCANVSQIHEGAIPALFSGKGSEIFIDKFAHTSIYQAVQIARAQGAKTRRVDIADLQVLRQRLKSSSRRNKVLFVDGIYSMQGHMPPLDEILKICEQENTILYIDDAHGIGIYGEKGGGVCEHFDLSFENMILVGSLQKGLGCYGGFLSGQSSLINMLRMKSTTYIFSGTIQPQAVEAGREAIRLTQSDSGKALRKQLTQTSADLRKRLQDIGFIVPDGDSPIIPVTIGNDIRTVMAGRKMFDEGVYLNSVLYPAVPKEHGILRISLTALHSKEDIEKLIHAFISLRSLLEQYRGRFEAFKWTSEVLKAKIQRESYVGL